MFTKKAKDTNQYWVSDRSDWSDPSDLSDPSESQIRALPLMGEMEGAYSFDPLKLPNNRQELPKHKFLLSVRPFS